MLDYFLEEKLFFTNDFGGLRASRYLAKLGEVMPYLLLGNFTIFIEKAEAKVTKYVLLHVPVELDQPVLGGHVRDGKLGQGGWRAVMVIRTIGFIGNFLVCCGSWKVGGRV